MATQHTPPSASRLRARLGLVAAAAVAAAGLVGVASPSSAAPEASIGSVQARIHALDAQAERITEAYDAAREQLSALRVKQRIAARELAAQRHRLVHGQAAIAATIDAAYRSGGLTDTLLLGPGGDPQTFLDRAATIDALTRVQAQQFATVAAAAHAVRSAQATYDARAAAVRATLTRIHDARAQIEQLLAEQRRILATLRAAQRARLAAAQAQQAVAMTALRGSYTGPASGQAGVAVRFAYAQLGKPYVYGAAGPGSYDCSGLTMAAWAAAGVALPHNAAMQQSVTRPVAYPALQPGDLVFFGSPAYHVAMYIGGGNIIEAPHTGDVVKIVSLSSMPSYSGAGRP